ncbi:c-type cytochrome [Melittangium boletus]|uniref:Cytochrome Cbb3 n=1 Tax=Melittangium boletus DSM 14713 TaxID=1294270 RepID=A0A250IDW3_9BACT|nr:c-type cytochrome [Melittangium boletus]ATB29331.1 cytochrome Cbb3 [Melittangium boletus DSM 14713]
MRAWAWAMALGVMAGCGPTPARDFGEALFKDPLLSESQYNAFSCATCHATSDAQAREKMYTGLSLVGAASRPSWWGGYEVRLIDAVNFCYTAFMRGTTPLGDEDPKSRALYEYLVSLSPESTSPAQPLTLVRDIAEVPRGDKNRGAEVYQAACQDCHGERSTGTGRLTSLAPVLPEVSREYGQLFPNATPALVFIEKVRHGRFFGVGGNMPPYSLEALSDEDLGALLSYLGL